MTEVLEFDDFVNTTKDTLVGHLGALLDKFYDGTLLIKHRNVTLDVMTDRESGEADCVIRANYEQVGSIDLMRSIVVSITFASAQFGIFSEDNDTYTPTTIGKIIEEWGDMGEDSIRERLEALLKSVEDIVNDRLLSLRGVPIPTY